MSLKRIICDTTLDNKKGKSKVLNTNEATHSRISLLSELFDVKKSQVVNNIIHSFFIENEEEIKDRIEIRRNHLDKMF